MAVAGEFRVADGVDAPVDAVEAAPPRPPRHGALAQAEKLQLVKGNHPMLPLRKLPDPHIDRKVNTLVALWLPNVLTFFVVWQKSSGKWSCGQALRSG